MKSASFEFNQIGGIVVPILQLAQGKSVGNCISSNFSGVWDSSEK